MRDIAASKPGQAFTLYLFYQFGALGNNIFFVCSAWFLTGSKKTYGKKVASIVTESWLVSVVILAAVLLSRTVNVNGARIIRSLMPMTFVNNWYLTNYCLFLVIVPFINVLIDKLSQKQHLVFVLFFAVLRIFVAPFTIEWASKIPMLALDQWIIFYFIVAYMKKYLPRCSSNTVLNLVLFTVSTAMLLLCTAMDTFEFKTNLLLEIFIHGWHDSRFYIFVMAVTLLNLFRKMEFRSGFVNRISGYSLLIYIIHENLLLRDYYRPMIMDFVHTRFGSDNIVMRVLTLTVFTLVFSLVLAVLFDLTVGRFSRWAAEKYYPGFRKKCSGLLEKLAKIG